MIIEEYCPYMLRALELAGFAEQNGDVPIGAVIVLNDTIIAEAFNQVEALNNPIAHAEILAIMQAIKKVNSSELLNCTLITTLEPCGMCSGAIANYRVGRVIFGAYDTQFGCLFSKVNLPQLMGKPVNIIGGLMEYKCKKMLDDFFTKLR